MGLKVFSNNDFSHLVFLYDIGGYLDAEIASSDIKQRCKYVIYTAVVSVSPKVSIYEKIEDKKFAIYGDLINHLCLGISVAVTLFSLPINHSSGIGFLLDSFLNIRLYNDFRHNIS